MRYILFITISIICIPIMPQQISPAKTLFISDIAQCITHYLEPDNIFLNYYQDQLKILPTTIQIMRKKYIAKKNLLLWQIFKRFIEPLHIEHYQRRLPIDSCINSENSILAIAYENAIIIHDLKFDELTRRFPCQSIPAKIFFNSNRLFVACKDGTINCIDLEKNETMNIRPTTNEITHAYADESNIYSIDNANNISQTSLSTKQSQTSLTIRTSNIVTIYQENNVLYLGTQDGKLLIYHFDRAILDDPIAIDGTPIVHIAPNNNESLYIETLKNTYIYNLTTRTYRLFTLNHYFPPCSLSSTDLKLFKQYDLISERFPHAKSILREMFYIGKIAFINLCTTICVISDDQKITVLNLEKILTAFSFKELRLICLLEEAYQSKYKICIFLEYLAKCCSKKTDNPLLQKEKWAETYKSLPIVYKKFVKNRYGL